MAKYDSILETIGNTPVVRLRHLAPQGVNLWVKVEAFNPMGSVKDRMARAVIEQAERSGALRPGQTVVEATSGNTGIALAMVCAEKGYPLVITMAENFSVERRRLMRFLGARVVLTPASEKGSGMLAKAVELARAHGWFLCRQFENEANADVHSATTAREILADFAADGLDYWVTGFGTGGTLKGVARVLKRESPRTRVVVCEPDNAPVLGSGVAQPRLADGSPAGSHPMFRPHPMQGWSPDFIAKLTEDAAREGLVDEIVPVSGTAALRLSQELARREGIFAGISSGATLAGALEVCRRAPSGANVLCMLTDTGERYLSTPLFAEVETEMNAEEMEISRSTPACRFDVPPSPASPGSASASQASPGSATADEADGEAEQVVDGIAAASASPASPGSATADEADGEAEQVVEIVADPAPPGPAALVETDAEAEQVVDRMIADPTRPVVMFALEWCEFCWSVRKLFRRLGIECLSVDLDSVEYQRGDLGGRIRAVLLRRTGRPTIPQVFVGGVHAGGCTDVFDAYRDGNLQARLNAVGVRFDTGVALDPYTLLPGWLHPRRAA